MKEHKFLEKIKKRWLVDGTKTILLIAIIITVFIALNIFMQKLELTPIDFSQEKLYTLTEESKEKVKKIDKDVNIYFIGYSEEDSNLELAKQYKKANEKIVAEAVDLNSRPDLTEKYGIETGSTGIIIESGEKSKVLSDSDLVTYDYSTYETINIAEEKLTSSILSVTSEVIPKIYFLEGYSSFSLNENMKYLNVFLENEVSEIETLNILNVGKVPDDCDVLVITTPSKDFDDLATNAIIDYINLGKNILWLNSAQTKQLDLPNANKILSLYAVNPFEVGSLRETNSENMAVQMPYIILPSIQNSAVTKGINTGTGVVLLSPTKININEDEKENQKITENEILMTSSGAYFRKDFTNEDNNLSAGEEKKEYLIGVELEKTIKEANEENSESAVKSKLILYGENYFITDYPLVQQSGYPAIQLGENKDLVLNSLAYLANRPEDVAARKSTGTVTYNPTDKQDKIVKIIIFVIPILIIVAGIVIWNIRRRKK